MQVKINRCTTNEDTAKVIQEFEEIAKNKKSNIVWLAYCQGQGTICQEYGFKIPSLL